MTSAARPTWVPAKGSEDQGGARMFGGRSSYSSKDARAQTVLKSRMPGQGGVDDLKSRDLKAELLLRESQHFEGKDELLAAQQLKYTGPSSSDDSSFSHVPKPITSEEKIEVPGIIDDEFAATGELNTRDEDADADFQEDEGLNNGGRSAADIDDDDDDDEDDSEDDEDDEAELLAELERIKKERAEEAERKAMEEKAASLDAHKDEILGGNPLLNLGGHASVEADFTVKRRWDDDVVFRNQTRNEPKKQKRFVNDTIRSDFHRRFLEKYIK